MKGSWAVRGSGGERVGGVRGRSGIFEGEFPWERPMDEGGKGDLKE